MALSEERSRCSEDLIEKRGLELLEPRPVNPMPSILDSDLNNGLGLIADIVSGPQNHVDAWGQPYQPPVVMGGIFEVMEGTA